MRPAHLAALAIALLIRGDGEARLVLEERSGEGPLVISGVGRPNGVMARPEAGNPVVRGKNLYAPDLVRNGESWNLFYGGWRDPADLNDRIYAAVCRGAAPLGPWGGGGVIIDRGNYVHVNDPSVQKVRPNLWVMAFTVNYPGERGDWIAVATSRDGLNFTPKVAVPDTEVVIDGAKFSSAGRPAIVWDGSRWKMWFDGIVGKGGRHCYLAESDDPIPRRFRLVHEYADVDRFPGMMAPDVALVDGRYVAVVQRGFSSLRKLVSRDGVRFEDAGEILVTSDPAFGRKFVSNPGWVDDGEGRLMGVAFGMTDSPGFTTHSLGLAWHQLRVQPVSPGNVGHLFGKALGPDAVAPLTFGYREFRHLTIEDTASKRKLFDRDIEARAGDRWRLVIDPTPNAR